MLNLQTQKQFNFRIELGEILKTYARVINRTRCCIFFWRFLG